MANMETQEGLATHTDVEAHSRRRSAVAALANSRLIDALLVLVLLVGVAVLHLWVPGTVPSGGDGGNWLALASERFGQDVMTAEVSYPPLLPAVLGLVEAISGESVLAITSIAIASKATLVIGVYICARTLTRLYAFIAALIVAVGGALLEAYAWGGYTQLMGMGFGLLATFFVVRYLATDLQSHLWIGIGFSLATVLTHAMVGALLGLALIIAVFHYVYMTDPRAEPRKRSLLFGLMVAVPVLVFAGVGYLLGSSEGFEPAVNPIELSRLDAVLSAVKEAPYPWLVVAVAGLSVLFFRYWPEHVASTVAVGFSWAVTSTGLFLLTGEPRALLITQVGLVLMAVVAFGALYEYLRPSSGARHSSPSFNGLWHRLLAVAGIALVAALVAGGIALYQTATDWYRVVDQPEIAALDQLVADSESGEVVLAARGHHGNPVGWWVEGYAKRPAYTAINTAFLAFPDEVEQAEFANAFFSGELTAQESQSLIDEIGARYIVVDKRGPDAFWLGTEFAQALPVLDDSSNIVILEVPPGDLN